MSTPCDERHSVANASSAFPVDKFEDQHAEVEVSQISTYIAPAYAAVGSPDCAYFEWDASQPVLSQTISASPPSPIASSTSQPSTSRPAKRPLTDDDAPQGSPKVPRLAKKGGLSSPDTALTEVQPKRKHNDYIRRLHESGYKAMSKDIVKEIGLIWRSLPYDESQYWKDQAKGVKGEHKTVYPGYKYKPVHKKKTGRPPKCKPRIDDILAELDEKEGKENNLQPKEDILAKRQGTLIEGGHTVENMRAIADRPHPQSRFPLHYSVYSQGAATAQYAETNKGPSYAAQAVPQFQPQFASVIPAFQQAGASCLATHHAWQPVHSSPGYTHNLDPAAYNGFARSNIAYPLTYRIGGNHAQHGHPTQMNGFEVVAPMSMYNAAQCPAYLPSPSHFYAGSPAALHHCGTTVQYTPLHAMPTPYSIHEPSSPYVGTPREFSQSAPPSQTAQGPSEEDVAWMLAVLEEQELLVPQHRDSPDLATSLMFPAEVHDHLTAPEELPQSAGRFSDMLRDIDRWSDSQ
ncbi:hypothetical protein POSPLADRAFT_1158054 [Postia placenta MAD-698-R-SB12]|uniref:HMG box domain-containing protein n=1 Tax=Postia placenta MAD-698-R-SB12 TaxID=670580 RepID=A0A1X6MKH7_9APHY|nr:hypothetical protein POSPLADRAFT_1158054 [Postia placenta MAD-698-R-SB12]OSX56894.1 hypothetical protein POSPLADRAFT_1158054 [Postia placenta MAD-698-R-SB12]